VTARTTSGSPLYGDWRASAYGAAKRAHLFVYDFSFKKHPACSVRIAYARTGAIRTRDLADLCYDCLAYAASGRPIDETPDGDPVNVVETTATPGQYSPAGTPTTARANGAEFAGGVAARTPIAVEVEEGVCAEYHIPYCPGPAGGDHECRCGATAPDHVDQPHDLDVVDGTVR
jgi:hypothetical protein